MDSLKKVELENLLSIELASDESSSFVFVDETRRFNFRESAYRLYEFAGHLSIAGKNPVPEVKYECEEGSNQTQVVISSDKGLSKACRTLRTKSPVDLGLIVFGKSTIDLGKRARTNESAMCRERRWMYRSDHRVLLANE